MIKNQRQGRDSVAALIHGIKQQDAEAGEQRLERKLPDDLKKGLAIFVGGDSWDCG